MQKNAVGLSGRLVCTSPGHGPYMVLHQGGSSAEDVVRLAIGPAPGQSPPHFAALVAPSELGVQRWHIHLWPWPAHEATVHFFDIPDDWLQAHTRCAVLLLADLAPTDSSSSGKDIAEVIERQLGPSDVDSLAHLDLLAARHTRWPHTWTATERDAIHIAVASCQYASGMVDGAPPASTWAPGPADLSYHRLGQWRHHTHVDAVLLVGDQVYNDATAGLFDPAAVDDRYHGPYRHWLSRRVVRQALAGPMVHALPDDHEFHDNWSPIGPLHAKFSDNNHVRDNGLSAYFAHLRGDRQGATPVWNHFQTGPIACFMMDTRTERERRQARTLAQARIMSSAQRAALDAWLGQHARQWAPKVMASPSMVLPRRHTSVANATAALQSDAWDGYPAALSDLLTLLWQRQARNVVFASGDEHLGCVCEIKISCPDQPELDVTAWSVHCPALYAPYPFANSRREDFLPRESFPLRASSHPGSALVCHVETWYPRPGDGFAMLRFQQKNGRWQGQVSFVQEDIAQGPPTSPEVCRTLF